MRRIFLYIYLILYATALVGANDTLTIGSGAEGKGYYNLALSIKKVLEDNNFSKNIIVKATNGSANNLEFLQKGEIELAIIQSDTAFYAQNGLNKFRSNPITNISTVIDFYQEPIYIVTNKEDIHSLEALKNLNVNFGLLNSGLAESAKVIFNAEGILDSIYATHQPENDAIKSLEEGNLNAFLTNAITPEVQKKLKEKNLFLVPVREAIIDSLNKTYGCFFRYKYKIDKLNSIP
ncbi:MAG TPA: TAXI family TRAP transporter solute-binding subunit, partial [Nitratifractor sp.]|nr:TAXI family TRAP transporter solute-binding subunit [Nitratifractor sp.]